MLSQEDFWDAVVLQAVGAGKTAAEAAATATTLLARRRTTAAGCRVVLVDAGPERIKTIKTLRSVLDLPLVEAMKLTEGLPKLIAETTQERAKALLKQIALAGGVAEIEDIGEAR